MTTPTLERQISNGQLPGWARVWAWCLANHDQHGHARAYPGQIAKALDLTTREVSRAIRLARDHRVIDSCSSARCLVLPGHALAPCEASHRGECV